MSYSTNSQMTSARTDFAEIWHNNRKQFARDLIDMKAMATLSDMLAQAKPQVVLMAARRMPRAVEVARLLNPVLFADRAIYYSDYALEFVAKKNSVTKVVIVDDAVNVGSTMVNIYERVKKAFGTPPIGCYALARKVGGGTACKNHFSITYAGAEWNNEDYRKYITGISRSQWILNLPLEVEFPVYRYALNGETLAALPGMLGKLWPGGTSQRVDMEDAALLGLHRFSIDISPGEEINNKIRIYGDSAKGELIVTPMAHCLPVGSNMRAWRLERFRASMLLMQDFEDKLGLPHPEPDADQARLLFGNTWEQVKNELNNIEIDSSKGSTTDFYTSSWPEIRKAFREEDRLWSLESCFVSFFKKLAKYVDEEGNSNYDRLLKGPTFGELLTIMDELWQKESPVSPRALHGMVSRLLDQYIDRGYVVPVVDRDGIRRFRKGEPNAASATALQLLRWLGKAATPCSDLDKMARDLSGDDQQRYEKMERSIQTRLASQFTNM